jgi:hypothetical protein
MRRPPGEHLILVSLGGSLGYCFYLALTGTLRLEGGKLAVTLVVAGLTIGASAFLLVIMRRIAGAVLSAAFYGLQLLSVVFPSGMKVEFNSLPAIYFRIYGNKDFPIKLNIVALLFFGLSLFLWEAYRKGEPNESAPPNTSCMDSSRK